MQIDPNKTVDSRQQELNTRRFGGIARLYGEQGLTHLNNAHVCIIGIGGVGSWVAESLVRSGVGTLSLIDMDVVSESNMNRQLVATETDIGRDKVLVMADRAYQINPACKVHMVDDFVSKDNLDELISKDFTFVIDCIDDFRTKAALISHCKQRKIKILSVGGAGGQTDPSKIRQSDLSLTHQDVLLAKTRKLLRQEYSFARNPKRTFGVPCVYSDEQLVYPDGVGGLSPRKPVHDPSDGKSSNALNCAGGIGSITHVTGSFGFVAAGFVINQIANTND